MVHGCEGTERCPVYVGPRFGSFSVLLSHPDFHGVIYVILPFFFSHHESLT